MRDYGQRFRRWLAERWLVEPDECGERVAGFWLKRPSECEDFRAWDGKSPNGVCQCDQRQQIAHAGMSARQRRKQHDGGAGVRWLPWEVRNRLGMYGLPGRNRPSRTWSTFAANVLRYEVMDPLQMRSTALIGTASGGRQPDLAGRQSADSALYPFGDGGRCPFLDRLTRARQSTHTTRALRSGHSPSWLGRRPRRRARTSVGTAPAGRLCRPWRQGSALRGQGQGRCTTPERHAIERRGGSQRPHVYERGPQSRAT